MTTAIIVILSVLLILAEARVIVLKKAIKLLREDHAETISEIRERCRLEGKSSEMSDAVLLSLYGKLIQWMQSEANMTNDEMEDLVIYMAEEYFPDQVMIERTPDGLRIGCIDSEEEKH